MKKTSAKLNYIYNLAYQIFSMITPLITTPYVARVLSADGVGQYSFAASINTYFLFVAALGFSIYAQREIAKNQGDKIKQSCIFWEMIICKIVSGVLSLVVCWTLIFSGIFGSYTMLLQIMSIEIVSTTVNIAFFFQGNERFGLITLRDFIIKTIGIIFIFCFVNKQEDLWLYALCTAGFSLLSSLSLWPCLKNNIVFIPRKELRPLRHLLPSLRLFIPTIAISIYTILDKTLIGVLIPGNVETVLQDGSVIVEKVADLENGYYAQSEKIIKMAMMVIASLGTVMMPRNSKELEAGHEDVFLNNVNKAIEFVFFVGAPICAGIIAASSNFSPWFFGPGYDKVPVLMKIFAVMVLPAGLGNVLGQQYLLPKGEDNRYVLAYVCSAAINFCLNLILIPQMLSYGAAIASIIAETIVPAIMLFAVKDKITLTQILNKNWRAILSATLMFVAVYGTSLLLAPSVINTVILVVEGIAVYLGVAFALKCTIAYEAIAIVKRKIIHK